MRGNTRRFSEYFQERWQNVRVPVLSHIVFGSASIAVTIGLGTMARHEKLWQERVQQRSLLDTWKESLLFGNNNSSPSRIQMLEREASVLEKVKFFVKEKTSRMREEEKGMWALIAVNSAVFLAWQLPSSRVRPFLERQFVHLPIANRPWTMLTCVFSHQSLLHFGFNMMALHSFYPALSRSANFSNEQALSFYLSAGVFSSLASHMFSKFIPGRALVGGLGASGAIYSLLMASAILNPTAGVGIIFIPGITFQMQELVPFVLLLDVVGVLLKWRSLDHVAHLGGALYGYLWMKEGRFYWAAMQKELYNQREGREIRK